MDLQTQNWKRTEIRILENTALELFMTIANNILSQKIGTEVEIRAHTNTWFWFTRTIS